MPQFVVLAHDWPHPHYDLMLEWRGTLRTWRLPEEPYSGCAIAVESLPDHRRRYLEYEGPVGNDRGWVVRWDKGTYAVDHASDDELCLHIQGERLHGALHITCEQDDHWQLQVLDDEPACAESRVEG